MKVCTDACLFGSWAATKCWDATSILDIGSGTGLLMLMLAQQTQAQIEGIEIEPRCYTQLQENVETSVWRNRLIPHLGDARSFSFNKQFDFIISNPPFYEQDLRSNVPAVNLARHSDQLNFEQLVVAIDRLLTPAGSFAVLVPYKRWHALDVICKEKRFHLLEKITISHDTGHTPFRTMLRYARGGTQEPVEENFNIHDQNSREYTKEALSLLKDYYLYL